VVVWVGNTDDAHSRLVNLVVGGIMVLGGKLSSSPCSRALVARRLLTLLVTGIAQFFPIGMSVDHFRERDRVTET